MKENYLDVVIIGGGAAGIGMGIFLQKSGLKNYCIFERTTVGASFSAWPNYIRFISPSFAGNFFNAVDLNALSPDTSPAYTLKTEHPTGKEYAEYLRLVVSHFTLNLKEHTSVLAISKKGDHFEIETQKEKLTSRFVIWAGGEFQNPNYLLFDGAEYCIHSSIAEDFPENNYTVIGGFESGMELAAHLLENGKSATIIDAGEPWEVHSSDSSLSLAPSTHDRLKPFIGTKNLRLHANSRVTKVEYENDMYKIILDTKTHVLSSTRPIVATGFHPLPVIMQDLFAQEKDGVLLTENDESTKTRGLFLVGPRVRHGGAIFCFIYKFRQRFAIVGKTIMERLSLPALAIEEYKNAHLYLKDLSCCTDECSC